MLIAKDIQKTYKSGAKEVKAVDGVSLEIKKGRSVAIVGPSGAGKSTLLHILGGLDRPTSGKISFDDTDLYRLSDSHRAALRNTRIGFVFQFYHLLPDFTILENVMLPALINRNASTHNTQYAIRKRANELLISVGLGSRAGHRPFELSGGEAQRAAIARALVNSPELLLCDEPTGNLDSKNRDAIYDLLFKLKSDTNSTLVIVTHDETLSKKTDHTFRMKDGLLV